MKVKYTIIAVIVLVAFIATAFGFHAYGNRKYEEGQDAVWSKIDRGLARASEKEATWSDIDGDGLTSITWYRDGRDVTVSGPTDIVGELVWCYEWLISDPGYTGGASAH